MSTNDVIMLRLTRDIVLMMAGIKITSHVFIDTKLHGNRRCLWVVAVLRGTQDYSLHVHSQNNHFIALYHTNLSVRLNIKMNI